MTPISKKQDIYYQLQAILARRDHSVAEVRQKLKRKTFPSLDIEQAIQRALAAGLLNDQRFAENFIESILRSRPVGTQYLKTKLIQRGVEASLINDALAHLFPSSREEAMRKEAAIRWRHTHPQAAHDQERLARFLVQRGFAWSSVLTLSEDV